MYVTFAIRKEKSDVEDCLTKLLSNYLKGDDPEPSWHALIKALRAKSVGYPNLAKEIKAKHLSGSISTGKCCLAGNLEDDNTEQTSASTAMNTQSDATGNLVEKLNDDTSRTEKTSTSTATNLSLIHI